MRGTAFNQEIGAVPTEMTATPNLALQQTAPRVTVAAFFGLDPSRSSAVLLNARSLFLRSTPQLPRRAQQSLSLGSLDRQPLADTARHDSHGSINRT